MKNMMRVMFLSMLFCSSVNAGEKVDTLNAQAIAMIDSDLDAAEALISELIEEHPQNHLTHFYCGRIMGRQAGEAFFKAFSYAKKSLACMKKAVALAPENITYKKGLISFYLGAPAIAGGSEALAFEQVKAIKLRNQEQGVLAELGFYKQTLDDSALTVKLLKYQQSERKTPAIAYELGLLFQHVKQFDKAHMQFEIALKTNPQNHTLRQNVLYQLGRNAVFSKTNILLGIESLKKYSKGDLNESLPSLNWAYYRLSQLHALNNDTRQAKKYRLLAEVTEDQQLIAQLAKDAR